MACWTVLLDAAPLGRAASVVGDGGDVDDGRGLEAGARTLDEDLDGLEPVLHRPPRRRLGGHLGGERRALTRALEALTARRAPGDDVALGIGEADDGVVEGGQDVRLADHDVLALAPPGPDYLLLLRHRLLLLPAHADGPAGAAAGPGVGPGALPAHRQATAVAEAAVGPDLHQPLDVERDLTAQVTLDPALQLLGDDVAQPSDLGVGEVLGPDVGGNAG